MAPSTANGASAVLSPEPAQLPVSSAAAGSSRTIEYKLSHPQPQPSNRYSRLTASQEIATIDHFELENGDVLQDVQVAYKTWGKLNKRRDNCMVICHALTGSADVEDWWGPMMGRGLAFDPSRYFIVCCNVLGSPYGSSSPVTINPSTGRRWGPEFPLATIRDDVRLHRIVLDYLGVLSVAVVIGGSMGGMQVLEWALCYPPTYVRNIIPMATSAHHSAWGISWGEAQRQSIYSDPNYEEGYYTDEDPPKYGLGAARMAALLTYRSRDSFESRFGRKEQQRRVPSPTTILKNGVLEANSGEEDSTPSTPAEQARHAHNDGYRPRRTASNASVSTLPPTGASLPSKTIPDLPSESSKPTSLTGAGRQPLVYSAQGYLRYQGDKFVSRFDANCYIAITRKMDSHDVCRGRPSPADNPDWHPLNEAPSDALVMAISSDALFTLGEQKELTATLPKARLVVIDSPEGHDGFLLEFEQINEHILEHLRERLPDIYSTEGLLATGEVEETVEEKLKEKKESLFGEAEADVTAW